MLDKFAPFVSVLVSVRECYLIFVVFRVSYRESYAIQVEHTKLTSSHSLKVRVIVVIFPYVKFPCFVALPHISTRSLVLYISGFFDQCT